MVAFIYSDDIKLTSDLKCNNGEGITLTNGACIDCDGHTITGPGNGENFIFGISIRDGQGTNIKNCSVTNFKGINDTSGIYVEENTSEIVIDNVNVYGNRKGIMANTVSNIEIKNSVIDDNERTGIVVVSSTDVSFTNVQVSNSNNGIKVHYSGGVKMGRIV